MSFRALDVGSSAVGSPAVGSIVWGAGRGVLGAPATLLLRSGDRLMVRRRTELLIGLTADNADLAFGGAERLIGALRRAGGPRLAVRPPVTDLRSDGASLIASVRIPVEWDAGPDHP